jgi:hypothetical protein
MEIPGGYVQALARAGPKNHKSSHKGHPDLFTITYLKKRILGPGKRRGICDKIKAAANMKPEVPAKPTPIVVNTPVFRGFYMSAQRRVWTNKLF